MKPKEFREVPYEVFFTESRDNHNFQVKSGKVLEAAKEKGLVMHQRISTGLSADFFLAEALFTVRAGTASSKYSSKTKLAYQRRQGCHSEM